jgi:hypothetical protein
LKPAERLFGDLLKRTGFLKKMAGSRNNDEVLLAGELIHRLLVHADDRAIVAADEQ